MGIYQIVNLDNHKVYIGSSKNIEQRFITHRKHLEEFKHSNNYLQQEYDKFGADRFRFEVIEYVENEEDLLQREQYWIDELDVCNENKGYKICPIAGSRDCEWTYENKGDTVKRVSIKNVDWMANYLSSKYRSMDFESTKDIIQNFMRVCKFEALQGRKVRINKVGTFTTKVKSEKRSKDFRGKPRIVPKMIVPCFITSSTFRDYINLED